MKLIPYDEGLWNLFQGNGKIRSLLKDMASGALPLPERWMLELSLLARGKDLVGYG